jgi:hypothetical protein
MHHDLYCEVCRETKTGEIEVADEHEDHEDHEDHEYHSGICEMCAEQAQNEPVPPEQVLLAADLMELDAAQQELAAASTNTEKISALTRFVSALRPAG